MPRTRPIWLCVLHSMAVNGTRSYSVWRDHLGEDPSPIASVLGEAWASAKSQTLAGSLSAVRCLIKGKHSELLLIFHCRQFCHLRKKNAFCNFLKDAHFSIVIWHSSHCFIKRYLKYQLKLGAAEGCKHAFFSVTLFHQYWNLENRKVSLGFREKLHDSGFWRKRLTIFMENCWIFEMGREHHTPSSQNFIEKLIRNKLSFWTSLISAAARALHGWGESTNITCSLWPGAWAAVAQHRSPPENGRVLYVRRGLRTSHGPAPAQGTAKSVVLHFL